MNTFLTKIPIAHRGLHTDSVPENSLAAFDAAVKAGYAIETDVRLTKDGTLVLFHDDDLSRMTGDRRKVAECTFDELQSLTLGGTKEKIPSFSEFLFRVDKNVPFLLEIKDVPEWETQRYLQKIADELHGYEGEYAVQSFQPKYVRGFKKLRPDILCGILATASSKKEDFGGSPVWRLKAFAVGHMTLNHWAKPDFISFNFPDFPTRETDQFKGIKLGWTVRSPLDEATARKYADNIIFEGYLPG